MADGLLTWRDGSPVITEGLSNASGLTRWRRGAPLTIQAATPSHYVVHDSYDARIEVHAKGELLLSYSGVADPPGATHVLPITNDHTKLAASMPDSGSTFAADLVIDQANAINYEGGAATFIDGLSANCTDLRVFDATRRVEIPFGVKQFSQVAGSRKLILGLGIKSTAPLSATSDTTYWLYRGCSGGTFESKSSVVPVADGFVDYSPLEESSGLRYDWTANANNLTASATPTQQNGQVGSGQSIDVADHDFLYADSSTGLNLTNLTIMAWLKVASYSEALDVWRTISLKQTVFSNSNWFCGLEARTHKLAFSRTIGGTGQAVYTTGACPAAGTWFHIAVRNDEVVNMDVLLNGAVNNSASFSGALSTAGTRLWVGSYDGGGGSGLLWFDGIIDEFQIHNVVRSTDWLSTYYAMTSSNATFWTVGDEITL